MTESIEQNGRKLFSSDDGRSISMICGNLTGGNFKNTEKREYLRYMKMMQREVDFEPGQEIVIFSEDQFGKRELGRRQTGVQVKEWTEDPRRIEEALALRLFRKIRKSEGYLGFGYDAVTSLVERASQNLKTETEWLRIYAMGFVQRYNIF